jgi:hypothetical protein
MPGSLPGLDLPAVVGWRLLSCSGCDISMRARSTEPYLAGRQPRDLHRRPAVTACLRCALSMKSGADKQGIGIGWRTGRDSNPRWLLHHARFPSVCLKPLGHLS